MIIYGPKQHIESYSAEIKSNPWTLAFCCFFFICRCLNGQWTTVSLKGQTERGGSMLQTSLRKSHRCAPLSADLTLSDELVVNC